MSKLGATLKNKRESLGLDIDKVTEHTRMSADIIAVLENGEYKGMPSYNHAKNFVKNYAAYLKLDLDQVQTLFEDECTKEDFNREVKYVAAPVTKERTPAPSGVKFIIPVVIVIFVIFAGIKIFSAMQKGNELREQGEVAEVKKDIDKQVDTPVAAEVAKEVVEKVNSTPAPETKPAEAPKADQKKAEVKKPEPPKETKKEIVEKPVDQTMSAFLPDVSDEPLTEPKKAIVSFADVCWVHIKIDDKEEIDFIAEKGTDRTISFHSDFVMDIGNAAVVSISYNDRTIAGLGAYKQPVKGLKFTVNDNNRLTYSSVK